mgnify:FL=1
MIAVEDLKVVNMSKSASGTLEQQGRNVKAKSGLNKSILDQGWSMLLGMLAYKQQWRGGLLVKVDPRYTSQTCSQCGYVAKGIGRLKLSLSVWSVVMLRMRIEMHLATYWRWDTPFCLWREDATKVTQRNRKQVKSVRKSSKSFGF